MIDSKNILLLFFLFFLFTFSHAQDVKWMLGTWNGTGKAHFTRTIVINSVNGNNFTGTRTNEADDRNHTKIITSLSGSINKEKIYIEDGKIIFKREPPHGIWLDCNCTAQNKIVVKYDRIILTCEIIGCGKDCDGISTYYKLLHDYDTATQLYLVNLFGKPELNDSLKIAADIARKKLQDSIKIAAIIEKKKQDSIEIASDIAKKKLQDSIKTAGIIEKKKQDSIKIASDIAKKKLQDSIKIAFDIAKKKQQDSLKIASAIEKKKQDSLKIASDIAKKKQQDSLKIASAIEKKKPDSIKIAANAAIKKPPVTNSSKSVVVPDDKSKALVQRDNVLLQSFHITTPDILIELFDNAQIDGDIVSVYDNNVLIVDKKKLLKQAIIVTVHADAANRTHEFILVAENLGTIPPNTALMRITAGKQMYELTVKSDLSKNAKVVLYYDGN
ncbi:MAG: hypothetical protein ABJA79_06110 [Parafilimonas sp.]